MKKIVLLIVFFSVVILNALSQNRQVTLHLDKDFYVSGETIWFKLYLPHAPVGKEIAIKASLLDQHGMIIHSYFCNTNGFRYISGKVDLPFDLVSNWYQLIFSNFDPKIRLENLLAGVHIPVYNDLSPYPPLNTMKPVVQTVEKFQNNLRIIPGRELIKPRQEMELELILTDSADIPLSGNASITILDETLNKVHEDIHTLYSGFPDGKIEYNSVFNFDFKCDILNSGNREYIGIFFKESYKFRYLSSLGNTFTLVHDPFSGEKESQEIFISNFNQTITKSSIALEPITSILPFNSKIKEYLDWSSLRKKTISIFPQVTSATSRPIVRSEPKEIPTPDRSIEVTKYDEFEDMFTFFKELSTPLKFKPDKNKRNFATIYNTDLSSDLEGKPKFIIDGIITDRADWIARLPMGMIKKVDIYFNTKTLLNFFGMIGKSGMVIIQTKAKLTWPDSIPRFGYKLNGFLPVQETFEIKKEQVSSAKVPLFMPVIYWNASVPIDAQGKAKIKFFHSDDQGVFLIKAISTDAKGNLANANAKYRVLSKS